MEIKNPLFQDDITPMSSPSVTNGTSSKETTPKDNDSKQQQSLQKLDTKSK
ncbi:neural proliferation differentiation and control protein 1-like [Euroglyphus maynei]|uniref:Neural proliferation differentiation and control protein 1-like n=1 Tax=Euroglyphus maynei TaxID=6958 RepID=A0A1Y3BR78_EURMA|nr:neural proliferation differentiation and control protein 1-like [Euroglyphus maynei]